MKFGIGIHYKSLRASVASLKSAQRQSYFTYGCKCLSTRIFHILDKFG